MGGKKTGDQEKNFRGRTGTNKRHISQMTSAWKPTKGTTMRGKEEGGRGGGGAGFSTGIHYCPTTDIKLVFSSPNSKNYCQKRKNSVALK